jgi:phosphoribosyl 1,2-cyclic phosphate phosphodiesterase
MKISFLGSGTSQGVPVIACECAVCSSPDPRDKRLRSSILVEFNGHVLSVDAGPDFRQQMLRGNVKHLDGILFTHAHRDHLSGLDDIRGFNFHMKKAIDVYCDKRVEKAIHRDFYYAFEEPRYPGVPEMNIHVFSNQPFNLLGMMIQPVQVYHHKLPVFGFRFDNFVYITDANHIPDEEKEKIRNCDVLVLNALRREQHISHFALGEAIALAADLNAGTAYFTHISHQLGLHEQVEKELPSNMHLAYDGLVLDL